jgi:hypothetical protein
MTDRLCFRHRSTVSPPAAMDIARSTRGIKQERIDLDPQGVY